MAATAKMGARPYALVVWGASGFTGKLVCEHISRDYPGKFKWAMAGRSREKLERVRQELCSINPDIKDVPLLVADAKSAEDVGAVLKQTKVVLSTAGPFAQIGNEVVAQAVAQGTHYCDITGEITWVKRNMEKYHKTAEAKGVKIVHCCGYDSVPSDMGALMMADYAQNVLGKKAAKVYTLSDGGKGGVSGGTIASGMNMMQTDGAEMAKVARDTYYLASFHNKQLGSDKPAPFLPTKLAEPDEWAGPFIMEGCNARVVHLSNALLSPQGPYGRDFRYTEMTAGGQGWAGFIKASLMSGFMTLGGLALSTSIGRWLLQKVVPKQGEGPSLEIQRTGYWHHKLVGVTESEGGQPGTVFTGECGDRRDPGYWSTSRLVLEAGLCMALDEDTLKESAKAGKIRDGGVLTPASAMGLTLLQRLRAAGFQFVVHGPRK